MDGKGVLITIIVPVYNGEEYLQELLDSITVQTYRNLEIILVDDGSTDSTGLICDNYAENDARMIVCHTKNGGLSKARNVGLDIAKGDFIGFADGDDILETDMYEFLLKKAEAYDADIVQCGVSHFWDDVGLIKPQKSHNEKDMIYGKWEAIKEIVEDSPSIRITVWNKLYKKEIFHNIRFTEGMLSEDLDILHCLILNANRIVVADSVKYYYRQHKGSIMSIKSNKLEWDTLSAYKKRYEMLFPIYPEFSECMARRLLGFAVAAYTSYIKNPAKSHNDRQSYQESIKQVINQYRHCHVNSTILRIKIFLIIFHSNIYSFLCKCIWRMR